MIKRLVIPIVIILLVLSISGCVTSSSSPLGPIIQLISSMIIVFIAIFILAIILLIYSPRLCGALLLIVGLFFTLTLFGVIIGFPLMLVGAILIAVGGKKKVEVNVTQNLKHEHHEKTEKEHRKKDEEDKIKEAEERSKRDEEEHMKILKQRYAKGEITKKQFERMKKDLE